MFDGKRAKMTQTQGNANFFMETMLRQLFLVRN
jgi:hypothetical protein